MRPPHRLVLTITATALLIVLAWYTLAPTQLGGHNAYVLTHGNSMQPRIHQGDLVITRQAGAYAVGNIVAYRDPRLGVVLHRIVAREEERFVLQGDNNGWLDTYQPRDHEIIGRLALQVPSVERWLTPLRAPAVLAVLVGAMVMVMMRPGSESSHDTRRAGTRGTGGRRRRSLGGAPTPLCDGLLLGAAVLGVLALVLGIVAVRRPLTRRASQEVGYTQTGAFRYTAATPPQVYDADHASTGEPLFLRLSEAAPVSFEYRFTSAAPRDGGGTYRLLARLGQDNGWQRTLELVPEKSFTGDSFTVSGVLNLVQVQELMRTVEQQTGVRPQKATVAIVPEVRVSGTLGGAPLQAAFAPALTFRYDPLQLVVEREGREDPLKPSKGGAVRRMTDAPNRLSLLFVGGTVRQARALALTGLVAAALAGLVALLLRYQTGRAAEPTRIRARYRALLLQVRGDDPSAGTRVIEVARIEDLAKLAVQDGRMILHRDDGAVQHYSVVDGDLVYRYTTRGAAPSDDTPGGEEQHAPSHPHAA